MQLPARRQQKKEQGKEDLILGLNHIDRTTWALRIPCPMSGLATRMTDTACLSFVQLRLQICASALLRLWPRSLSSSDDLSWPVIALSADHAHCWVHVVDPNGCRDLPLPPGEAREFRFESETPLRAA